MENTTNIPQGLYEDFNHFENPNQQADEESLTDFELIDKNKFQDHLSQSEQQKQKNPDILQFESSIEQISLWARNKRIQDIVQEPILPLVLLLGPQQATNSVQKIILEQMKIQRQSTGNSQSGAGASSQNVNDLQETSRHNLRIKSYDFFNTYRTPMKELPSFYKEQLNGTSGGMFKKSNQKDIGYLKRRFFDSISIFKPSVTIFIFDPQRKIGFDWNSYETQIIDELKTFQEKCQITAKQTRIIILVFVPQTATDAEKSQNSLRKAIDQLSSAHNQKNKDAATQNAVNFTTQQLLTQNQSSINSSQITNDDKIIMQSSGDQAFQLLLNVKAVMVLSQGMDGLKKNPKDLIKKVNEYTQSYYADKKRHNKNLEKSLVRKDQTQRVRYQFKIGIYSVLSKSDITSGINHTKMAYDDLRIGMGPGVTISRQAFEQRRENADIIMIQMLVYLLDQKNYDQFIRQFEAHLHCWKNQIETIKNGSVYQAASSYGPGGIQTSPAPQTVAGINQQISLIILKAEELKWRANWHFIIAQMLNQKPILFNPSLNIYQKQTSHNKQSNKGEHIVGNLLTDTLVESYFSGQHYLNCFFSLIKRKNDLLDFVNNFKTPEYDDLNIISWLEKELADIEFRDNNKMVGTDYELVKKSNPLNPLADSQQNSQFGLGQGLSSALTQVGLDKHKLLQQLKGFDILNRQILRIGQLALSSYTTKNQLMSQIELEGLNNQKLSNAVSTSGQFKYLRSQCRRKIQSIQFHISSHIFQLYTEHQILINNPQSPLSKLYSQQQIFEHEQFQLDKLFFPDTLLLKEAQKHRDLVSNQMINAGWNEQGIAILERSRDIQEALCRQNKKFEDFLLYELKILNYSPSISQDELNKRFLMMITDCERHFQQGNSEGAEFIVGELEGAKLIWARASFSTKMGMDVQVNSWVKLTIEIFTRIKNPKNSGDIDDLQPQTQDVGKKTLNLESVQLQFNSQQFDFTINESEQSQLEIIRGKPLVLEKNIYLNEDIVYNALKSNQKNQIYIDSVPIKIGTRNTLNLILEKVKIKFKNSPLQLNMSPYLTAKDKIQSHIERKGAGLKLPVQLNIKDMQPMLTFDLGQQDKQNTTETVVDNHLAYEETLIGNSQKIDICIKKEDLINIKHLSLIIEKIEKSDEEKNKTIFEQPQRRSALGGMSDLMQENKEVAKNEYQVKFQIQSQEIEDLDYPNNKKILFSRQCLESITNKLDNQNIHLKIFFTFYEPAMNKVKFRFQYTFTKTHFKGLRDQDALFAGQDHNIDLLGIQDQENQDLQRVESNEFQQDYYTTLKIRSISPIQVEWKVIRQTDHYLNALEYELNVDQQIKNNENSKGLKKPIVDQKQTEMRVSLNQNFKIACKITNIAKYRSVQLISKNIQLTLPHVNLLCQSPPESEDQTLPASNADFPTILDFLKRTCLKQLKLVIEGEEEKLAPSESTTLITKDLNLSYEILDWLYENQDIQMQLDNILAQQNGDITQEDKPIVEDILSLESQKQLEKLQSRGSSRIDSNSKIRKTASSHHNAFVVQTPFQLNLEWKEESQNVFCEIESKQQLHLIQVAIETKIIVGSDELEQIKLFVDCPVEVIYRIKNMCDDKIFETLVLVDNTYYMFYVCGDVKSKIDLLPLQEIELRYTLIPLKPGICNLPNLHIFDRIANPEIIDLQPRSLNSNEWLQEHPNLAYLAKAVTKRVFVVQ